MNITGKGRCNVTNDSTCESCSPTCRRTRGFYTPCFPASTGNDAIDFFEGLGVPLKVERGKRVFPVSDRSFDITAALERELKRLHVKPPCATARSVFLVEDGHVAAVKGEKGDYTVPAVILATGGCPIPRRARRATASAWRKRSATAVTLRGSLVPLEARECAVLQGAEPAQRCADGIRKQQKDSLGFRRNAVHASSA
ncbi:MAG: NAD(P)/FAD-dependent oxidoreductase [Oscillibacter sp.]